MWAELADGSCRWRQTGSEIKVICLKVPEDVAAKELDVSLQPFNIRVAHKHTKEVCYSIVLNPMWQPWTSTVMWPAKTMEETGGSIVLYRCI